MHTSGSDPELEVIGITQDSRNVTSGMAFIAIRGTEVDGHLFLEDAVENGASVIICEDSFYTESDSVWVIEVESTRAILGKLAQAFVQNPADSLRIIGVTGTNGKTTTATLIYQILTAAGKKTSLLGTVSKRILADEIESSLTTADPIELAVDMKNMVNAGSEFLVMEVSSHALHQQRVNGFDFEIAAFTNLSHDHLDYHRTMDQYADAKKLLFDGLRSTSTAVINADDPYGAHMISNCDADCVEISFKTDRYELISESSNGITLRIADIAIDSPLIGRFNAYNLATACEVALAAGVEKAELKQAVLQANGAIGRMEKITSKPDRGPVVIVDYAHTPDALEHVVTTLMRLKLEKESLTVIFGAGGNRDRSKRPEMAKAAALADKVVVTSDNPRFEDPGKIIDDIMAGFEDPDPVIQITDRREAISKTIAEAGEHELILIAGKGHEDYQDVKGTKHPFDDRRIAEQALQKRSGGN